MWLKIVSKQYHVKHWPLSKEESADTAQFFHFWKCIRTTGVSDTGTCCHGTDQPAIPINPDAFQSNTVFTLAQPSHPDPSTNFLNIHKMIYSHGTVVAVMSVCELTHTRQRERNGIEPFRPHISQTVCKRTSSRSMLCGCHRNHSVSWAGSVIWKKGGVSQWVNESSVVYWLKLVTRNS